MPEAVRERVLDPARSFVVQAPAGSGKTEVLIRRFLLLLAHVQKPEEILALTFTRKAVGEMRMRVIQALREARKDRPVDPVQAMTWDLARRALERNDLLGWGLLEQPHRLRIGTLDALALWLAERLPILTGLGGGISPIEDAKPMYEEATYRLLAILGDDSQPDLSASISRLLLHLEHREMYLIELISSLLERREQWLSPVVSIRTNPVSFQQTLMETLHTLVRDRLGGMLSLFPSRHLTEALRLGGLAARHLGRANPDHPIGPLADAPTALTDDPVHLPVWRALASLLLTSQGAWRKPGGINARAGFPPEEAEAKERMRTLLEKLSGMEELAEALHALRAIPANLSFGAEEWELIRNLGQVLIRAAAELSLVFAEKGIVDYTEISLRALEALGTESNPEEILLRLDASIQHLLIDEFQDTSTLQIDLLRRLVSGWQAGDGRTLFIVGDPMQSIYGFRKAEVGLMLEAERGELFPVPVVCEQLRRNFRSCPEIVNWVNHAFQEVFPRLDDPALGRVSYTPCEPDPGKKGGTVSIHLLHSPDEVLEARLIGEEVQRLLARHADWRIGILAVARRHLREIMRYLSGAGVSFTSLEVLPLPDRPEVQDAYSLFRSIYHGGDGVAMASVLTSPFVGISIQGLHALIGVSSNGLPMEWLTAARKGLASEDDQRLQRFLRIYEEVRRHVPVCRWRQAVERAWLNLGGPALLDEQAVANVESFFTLLDELDDGSPPDFAQISRRLEREYEKPVQQDGARVEMVTIHGAKGLQWDAVLIPGLGHRTRGEDSGLLAFSPVMIQGEDRVVLSPRPRRGESSELYDFVRFLRRDRRGQEDRRLLYVAATRACKYLSLFGHVSLDRRQGRFRPASGSMLSLLVPSALRGDESRLFGADLTWHEAAGEMGADRQRTSRQRIMLPCPLPDFAAQRLPVGERSVQPMAPAQPPFDWAHEIARCVGMALHEALRIVGSAGIESWDRAMEQRAFALMWRVLLAEGLTGERLEEARDRCREGMANIRRSPRAGWILSSRHRQARCEWPLAARLDGHVIRVRIDRSFIDRRGCRWVIDYKTGVHAGSDVESFLDQEQDRYREQLNTYGRILRLMEERPIRLGLYFPMLDGWREWGCDSDEIATQQGVERD